tara:strand:+ start:436 stop:786 length:351 start_codon:yes stop_codon:yes gene_type:complete
VIICNGCCCGRVEKGHNEVPIDELEAAWEANRIGEVVKLTISDCLGPCSMHNVSLLNTGNGKIWLGELSSWNDYEAIVEWAIESSEKREGSKLPEILEARRFVRVGESIVRLKDLG